MISHGAQVLAEREEILDFIPHPSEDPGALADVAL
jgi:hypothetical protein